MIFAKTPSIGILRVFLQKNRHLPEFCNFWSTPSSGFFAITPSTGILRVLLKHHLPEFYNFWSTPSTGFFTITPSTGFFYYNAIYRNFGDFYIQNIEFFCNFLFLWNLPMIRSNWEFSSADFESLLDSFSLPIRKVSNVLSSTSPEGKSFSAVSSWFFCKCLRLYQMVAAMASKMWNTRKKTDTNRTKVVKAQQNWRIRTIMILELHILLTLWYHITDDTWKFNSIFLLSSSFFTFGHYPEKYKK